MSFSSLIFNNNMFAIIAHVSTTVKKYKNPPLKGGFLGIAINYLITLVMTPEPTVLPPSRIAKRS